jgi:hypothetical protein
MSLGEYSIETLIAELKTTRQEVSEIRFVITADIVVLSITFALISMFIVLEANRMLAKYKRLTDERGAGASA